MTEFNLPLLRKAVEWAESEATKPRDESHWNQRLFATQRACGTAYCIAGYVVAEHAEGEHNVATHHIDNDGSAKIAQDLLGIDREDAWGRLGGVGLFSACNSIEDVRYVAERIARKHGEEL